KVDDVTELEWAMDGIGTDEDAIKNRLKGKSKAEIAEINRKWDEKHPNGPSLYASLDDELSGRDWHEVQMAMKGKPETPAEMLEQARENYEYDRGSGSNWFSRGVTDAFGGDAGEDLERDHQKLVDLENKLKDEHKINVAS